MTLEAHTEIIVLAAGKGTRMKSEKAKVLHEVCGKPMLFYVLDTAVAVAGRGVVVVVGHQAETVREIVSSRYDVSYALQAEQMGTGHAVQCAMPFLSEKTRDVVILYGDVPLLSRHTVERFLTTHREQENDATLLAVEMDDPAGYGRVLRDAGGRPTRIVEDADADEDQKEIRIINTGIYCLKKKFLDKVLPRLKDDNAQAEYYLTDIVAIGHGDGDRMGCVVSRDAEETLGVNEHTDLMRVEQVMQRRQGNIA